MPLTILSQNLNGRFTSSFYTFERYNSPTSSESYIRTYQALNLNFNYSKVSLRTRFNLEGNLSNSLDSDMRMRFYNLYLEARDLFDVATLKVGRQPLFTPVAGGLFDGANLKLKFSGFSLMGYYGGNVPAYQKLEITSNLSDDYIMGGRFEINAIENFRLGLSYVDKHFLPVDYSAYRLDEDLNPVTVLIQQKSNQYKYVSADAGYYGPIAEINTRYEYDLNYNETSKFELDGRVKATDILGLNFYYNFREPKIAYNSIFSVFNYGSSQEIEGGLDLKFTGLYTFFIKYGDVVFEQQHSSRITMGGNTDFGSISYRKTFGDAGELDAISIFAARSFADGFITPSIGISFTNYKLSRDDAINSITSFLAGFNLRPWRTFSFDLQGQYFDNKIYKNDYRVLVKVNYLFNTNF